MIAFEQDHFIRLGTLEQLVQHPAGIGPPINVVADKHHNRAADGVRGGVIVDTCEHLLEQISATMYVANRIDAYPLRQT